MAPNNWVILVNSSRYWFNYRHLTNILTIYRIVKSLGINDNHILLLNAFDLVHNERNIYSGSMYHDLAKVIDLYQNVEIDYHGDEVTGNLFLQLLSGKSDKDIPIAKRLQSNSDSNILVYLSGHGGDEFFKFHDTEEISALDLAESIKELGRKNMYRNILFMTDTCKSLTLSKYMSQLRNITYVSSSGASENSYAYDTDPVLGVALIDRFTFKLAEFFDKYHTMLKNKKMVSLQALMNVMDPKFLYSHVQFMTTTGLTPSKIALNDFFSNVEEAYSNHYMTYNYLNSTTSSINWWNVAATGVISNTGITESKINIGPGNIAPLQLHSELVMLIVIVIVYFLFKCVNNK